ncbi:exocyst complex component 8 [Anaeramoeba ignava]|uniref:Exocyst complex component 8 n=1 Tax=Anaeramoeba ignava TaxID=1746090 RepID=A0A9Q0LTM6_ANAIG|nr:exocyst complex component 8 [Anaeramoeba ignava]
MLMHNRINFREKPANKTPTELMKEMRQESLIELIENPEKTSNEFQKSLQNERLQINENLNETIFTFGAHQRSYDLPKVLNIITQNIESGGIERKQMEREKEEKKHDENNEIEKTQGKKKTKKRTEKKKEQKIDKKKKKFVASKKVVELTRKFRQQQFDPVHTTREYCRQNNETKIEKTLNILAEKREQASQRLREKVLENYQSFIQTSNVISQMENDLQIMHKLLEENVSNVKEMEIFTTYEHTFNNLELIPLFAEKKNELLQREISAKLVWIFNSPQRLKLSIKQRNFQNCVDLIEKVLDVLNKNSNLQRIQLVKTHKDHVQPDELSKPKFFVEIFKRKIEKKREKLCKVLYATLNSPAINKQESRECLSLLVRLGKSEEAQNFFLESRRELITKKIKEIQFEGDLLIYVSELSKRVFVALRQTCEDFRSSFVFKPTFSSLIIWLTQEIERLISILYRQLHHTNNFQIIIECVGIVNRYHHLTLQNIGIDISFLFPQYFFPLIATSLSGYVDRIKNTFSKLVAEEQWVSKELILQRKEANVLQQTNEKRNTSEIPSNTPTSVIIKLSHSAREFYTYINNFVADVSEIVSIELYSHVINSVVELFNFYISLLNKKMFQYISSDIRDAITIISNSLNIFSDLLPRVIDRFEHLLKRPANQLNALIHQLSQKHYQMIESFSQHFARVLVSSDSFRELMATNYYAKTVDLESAVPSKTITDAMIAIFSLPTKFERSNLSIEMIDEIVSLCIYEITEIYANEAKDWEKFKHIVFYEGGLQQIVLDMQFIRRCSRFLDNKKILENITQVTKSAIISYCKMNKTDPQSVLQPEIWFSSRLDAFVSNNQFLSRSRYLENPRNRKKKKNK